MRKRSAKIINDAIKQPFHIDNYKIAIKCRICFAFNMLEKGLSSENFRFSYEFPANLIFSQFHSDIKRKIAGEFFNRLINQRLPQQGCDL